jgi:hypothetical protein
MRERVPLVVAGVAGAHPAAQRRGAAVPLAIARLSRCLDADPTRRA